MLPGRSTRNKPEAPGGTHPLSLPATVGGDSIQGQRARAGMAPMTSPSLPEVAGGLLMAPPVLTFVLVANPTSAGSFVFKKILPSFVIPPPLATFVHVARPSLSASTAGAVLSFLAVRCGEASLVRRLHGVCAVLGLEVSSCARRLRLGSWLLFGRPIALRGLSLSGCSCSGGLAAST
eukprot:TRINITY_DN14695_c0_g2_i1.p1 TRINITY_DN14695_c0_g2~~TRINITY_DN14695_c0_g2_i1.p1  ORF type:complete len:178 (+),score=3.96 TRINITY_DN14695_c0_g2_i1:354-887(+)